MCIHGMVLVCLTTITPHTYTRITSRLRIEFNFLDISTLIRCVTDSSRSHSELAVCLGESRGIVLAKLGRLLVENQSRLLAACHRRKKI